MAETTIAVAMVILSLYGAFRLVGDLIGLAQRWSKDEKPAEPIHAVHSKAYFDKMVASDTLVYPPIQVPANYVAASKPIDKRRRGVAEMRHLAEQESMKPLIHQAEVTAKNTRAMEG